MTEKSSSWVKIYSWEDIDHVKPVRWIIWYVIFIFIMLSICIWGFIEKVYTMPLVFTVLTVVYFIASNREPVSQENTITTLWIKINKRFVAYSNINSFWFIYYENIHLLHIKLNLRNKAIIVVPVVSWNSSTIRDLLLWRDLVEIEGMSESTDEIISRILKL